MRNSLIGGPLAAVALAGAAQAEVPSVVVDIPPLHALAAQVMQGLGSPELLVQPGASPHSYALRPSEARALDGAEVVFWVGEGLTPWLADSIEALAGEAHVLSLMAVEGTTRHDFRQGAAFGDSHAGHGHAEHAEASHDDHGHEDHAHDDHAHEAHDDHDHGHADHAEAEHDDHGHEDHAHDEHGDHGHDDHGHEDHAHDDHGHEAHDHDHHGHDHSGQDPHAWLDPENARLWLSAMAEELAALDPENAETYRANAEAGRAALAELIAEIEADLAPVQGRPFVVFHDAYQYFEHRFDLAAAGAISLSDASAPSAARIAEIQARVTELEVRCVFSEPQYDPRLVQTVLRGTGAETGVIDPLGVALEPGAALYGDLIRGMADTLVTCLK